ncbi:hypothetical protein LCER1_G008115 [Lachnellula cervina]|uniref:Uncharacterized protein n=1 Tax=Lachnellula cervina TaxID=1316786 RepID=A0A7D8UL86_9HELO|nr:hypothetical protein LCER1_G008115 [Lachnellula cervina]
MSSVLDDFDFQKFIDSNQSPDEFFDNPAGSQQAADHNMSGMDPNSPPPQLNHASTHSPSQVPGEAVQQNMPNMPTPEPKREDSEGLFLPDIQYAPSADDFGSPAGLEEDADEERFTPEPTMGGNSHHLPELASPINFGSMFEDSPHKQASGVSSRRNGVVYPAPARHDPTPESAPSITNEDPGDRTSPSPSASSSPSEDGNLGPQVKQLTIKDDDFVMINAEDAPAAAQHKWAQPHIPAVLEKPVKQEPREASIRLPTPAPTNSLTVQQMKQMMAAQKVMIQASLRKNDATKASIFGARKSVEAESSHGKRQSFVQIGDEHENANAAMGDADENDLSWMHEEDTGHDEEYENLVTVRNTLQMRRENGKITQEEKLELHNLTKRIESKDRVRRAVALALSQGEEDEEGLFVPEEREEVVGRHIRDRPTKSTLQSGQDDPDEDPTFRQMLQESFGGSNEGLDDFGNPKPTKGKRQKKATSKRPTNAREVRAQEDAKREKDRAKAQKGKKAPAAKSGAKKGAPVPKSKGKAKSAKNGNAASRLNVTTRSESLLRPANQFNRNSGQDPAGRIILEDLILNDPINDRLNQNDPSFDVHPDAAIEVRKAVRQYPSWRK